MHELTLSEVVRAGRVAESASEDGARLRYHPDQQRIGKAPIIEVTWPADRRGAPFGLVEVVPDDSTELLVQAANVPGNDCWQAEPFVLPRICAHGWHHETGCDCRHCQTGQAARRLAGERDR